MQTLNDLVAAVAALQTVDEGMEALLATLTQKIANLQTVNTDATTAAAIDALVLEVNGIRDTAAAAIMANTPADPNLAAAPVAPPPVQPADDVVVSVPVADSAAPVSVAPPGEGFVASIPPIGTGAVEQPGIASGDDLTASLQASHAAAKADDSEALT